MDDKRKLQFRNNGSFRVLHLTDIQEGIHPRKDTLRLIIREEGKHHTAKGLKTKSCRRCGVSGNVRRK